MYVLILQLLLCFAVSVLNVVICRDINNLSVYLSDETECNTSFLFTFASYLLLLNTMIPISLIVSLEFIKVGQAYYMEKDTELYSIFNKQPLKVFSCTVNEELGQIQHVFSDKTGTLTCNKMEFKMLICGKDTYGDYNLEDLNPPKQFQRNQTTAFQANRKRMPSYIDNRSGVEFCFRDQVLEDMLNDEPQGSDVSESLQTPIQFNSSIQPQKLFELKTKKTLAHELLLLLSTCHECVLQINKETQRKTYQGPSPDEIALVDAASHMGYAYSGLDNREMVVNVRGKEKRVELLQSFEFDSDRKRMSVIVRDQGIIKMYVKGADSIIKARLKKNAEQPFLQNIDKSLESFSTKGLRTLCLAMRVFSNEEYEIIQKQIEETIGAHNKEKLMKSIAENIEQELILLGATAVEDRLQDNVPAVLRDFLKANINVWMLTGDKLETAENIGRSCNLITQSMGVIYIRGANSTHNKIDEQLKSIFQSIRQLHSQYKEGLALVIEGESLSWILCEDTRKMNFLKIIVECKSVICCRVTPKQKADVVKLVKQKLNKITLAIGDGANDVNMIQEAHIGIGIYGNEGMRAVQASDYAIGQFQFLWKLVLYHGRLNYIRIAECILYFFYKNFVFTFPQLFFSFYVNYSGQSIFDDWYTTLYNCVFTFWPIVIKSVYEEDVYYRKEKNIKSGEETEERVAISSFSNEDNDIIQQFYPKLYYIGQANRIFQFQRFVKWVMLGVFQGALCFFLHAYIFTEGMIDQTGHTSDIWIMSISLYTSIIILVNLKLALNTQMWTIWNWVAFIFTSIGLYFAYIWISDIWPSSVVYLTAGTLFKSCKFYLTVSLNILTCFAFDSLLLAAKTSKDSLLNYLKKVTRNKSEAELDKIELLQDKLQRELLSTSYRESMKQNDSSNKKQDNNQTNQNDYTPSRYTSFINDQRNSYNSDNQVRQSYNGNQTSDNTIHIPSNSNLQIPTSNRLTPTSFSNGGQQKKIKYHGNANSNNNSNQNSPNKVSKSQTEISEENSFAFNKNNRQTFGPQNEIDIKNDDL